MQVLYTRRAEKDLRSLPQHIKNQVFFLISVLTDNPLVGKPLTGEFAGCRAIRRVPYRVIYLFVPKKQQIWIVKIQHRKDVYR